MLELSLHQDVLKFNVGPVFEEVLLNSSPVLQHCHLISTLSEL